MSPNLNLKIPVGVSALSSSSTSSSQYQGPGNFGGSTAQATGEGTPRSKNFFSQCSVCIILFGWSQ